MSEETQRFDRKSLRLVSGSKADFAASGEINRRIGQEVAYRTLKRALDDLVEVGQVRYEGQAKGRRYWPVPE